jgi:DNA excision repair protein ERCC-4
MTITADVGEGRSGVPDLLRALGVDVVIAHLPAGDYVVGPGEVVERKTVGDLHRSIAASRLWRQLEKLRRESRRAWLLVEGRSIDAGQVSPAGVRGALLAVVETGVPLIWSESPRDSALWLKRLHRRTRSAAPSPWVMRAPRRTTTPSPTSVLVGIPGVSPLVARRLLERFGSIEAIAVASPTELMAVTGIGQQRSRTLTALLSGTSSSGTSREARSAQAPPPTPSDRTRR